jgi:integrase
VDAQKLVAALIVAGVDPREIEKGLTDSRAAAEDDRLSENSIADESDGALPPGVRPMKRIHGPYEKRKKFRIVIVDCATGAQKYKSYATREDAERALKEYRREAIREAVEENGLKLDDAIDQYAQHLRDIGRRAGTVETTTHRLRALFKPALRLPVSLLTAKQAERLYSQFCNGKTRRGKLPSGDTTRNTLSEGKRLLEWCAKKGHSKNNVLAEVEGRGIKNAGKKQLKAKEARRWLETAIPMLETDEWVVAAVACLLLGVRSSEIVNRQVRDLDERDGATVLDLTEATTKTKAGERIQEVPELLKPHLLRLAQCKRGDQYLFSHQGKKATDRTAAACRMLCRLTRDVPRVTPHGLRGSHSSLAQHAGVTAHVVAAALGHTSPTTTLKHYTTPSAAKAGPQRAVEHLLLGASRETFPAISRPEEPGTTLPPETPKPLISQGLSCARRGNRTPMAVNR